MRSTIEFIHDLAWSDLPGPVQKQARRCLLDTLGAAIGGRRTDLSRIVHDFVASAYPGQGAFLWLDGRPVSPPGAALANGMTVDALDIHDGHSVVKGHAGAAIVPATLATLCLASGDPVSGEELLVTLVMGYEVALRAGLALHRTACDYHTSGAWNALGCASVTTRRLKASAKTTRHALGIAEYHGPRSQMMRCIDHPTMLKDGSGWGAMAGVSAGLMADGGFTGAPALTVEAPEVSDIWADMGRRWLIQESYFKPQAVCRWAQPAIVGAMALRRAHTIPLDAIRQIRVITFHQAIRLDGRQPQTTEEAQYSLPFPLAAALVHGQLGPGELSGDGLRDPLVRQLAQRVNLVEDAGYSRRFPQERLARVEIETATGQVLDSGEVGSQWESAAPPTDQELRAKFGWLAGGVLSSTRATQLERTVWGIQALPATTLVDLLAPPADVGNW